MSFCAFREMALQHLNLNISKGSSIYYYAQLLFIYRNFCVLNGQIHRKIPYFLVLSPPRIEALDPMIEIIEPLSLYSRLYGKVTWGSIWEKVIKPREAVFEETYGHVNVRIVLLASRPVKMHFSVGIEDCVEFMHQAILERLDIVVS